MNMIIHKTKGINLAVAFFAVFCKVFQIEASILVIKEYRLAIIASLSYMVGVSNDYYSSNAWHENNISPELNIVKDKWDVSLIKTN